MLIKNSFIVRGRTNTESAYWNNVTILDMVVVVIGVVIIVIMVALCGDDVGGSSSSSSSMSPAPVCRSVLRV